MEVGDDLNEIESLIDEHGKSIYNFCTYLARNKSDAEDLFQGTFLSYNIPRLIIVNTHHHGVTEHNI